MPRSKQRYILDVDDLLQPEFMTPCNANNLIKGLNTSATTPLAARAGGTGVVSKNSYQDGQLMRYNAAADKIIGTILNQSDLDSVVATGDLAGFYPGPSIRDNAVIYDYIGTVNQVGDVLNAQTVTSININNAGSGYSSNTYAVVAAPSSSVSGSQALIQLILGAGGAAGTIVGTQILNVGNGYTNTPAVSVIDPGAGGSGLQIARFTASPTAEFMSGAFNESSITLFALGQNYTAAATATAHRSSGTAATLVPTINSNGQITAITVSSAGTGYNATTARPVITIQDTGTGTGAQFVAYANSLGQLVAASPYYTFGTGGTGYSSNSTVVVSPPTAANGVQAAATLNTNGSGVVTGVTVTNPGSGYTYGSYFTFVITDPGSGGTGAALTATVLNYPATSGTCLLGATPSGNGDYALEWFSQVDLSFLDGRVSPTILYDQIYNAGTGNVYQYYTVPVNCQSLQIEMYGAGGQGGKGAAGSGTKDGGGGGGGAYLKFKLSATQVGALVAFPGQGGAQIQILVGQGFSGAGDTIVNLGPSAGPYNFIAHGGASGIDNQSYAHPPGGAGGTASPGSGYTTLAQLSGGTGNEGAGQDGVWYQASGAYFGDGATNGLSFSNGSSFQNNASHSDSHNGGNGATPGNGGGGGRNGRAGGLGGNGRVIITAFVANDLVGTTSKLLVPKVLGLFSWLSGTPAFVFGSNILSSWTFTGTILTINMQVPFALPYYMIEAKLIAVPSTGGYANISAITVTPVIVSASQFTITLGTALSNIDALLSFSAYGPE